MKYFIVSGEASGDLHSSNLMKELKIKDANAEFFFFGGDKMKAVGGELLVHYRDMAFMGFLNVLKNYDKIAANFKIAHQTILKIKPDTVILVDYPGFNLRLAKFVKKHTKIPVVYYISPKLWAWKSYRIKDIRNYVDYMITIFPFETEFYKKFNYKVSYAGNPTIDSIGEALRNITCPQEFKNRNGLNDKNIISVLPGSRVQEIKSCLPKMLDAALRFNDHQIVVAQSDSVPNEIYSEIIQDLPVKLVKSQTYTLLKHSEAAIVNSGTATLETALIGTPQVIVYDVMLGRFGILMKDLFIKTKYVSLVNIVAGREVVRELLGYMFKPDKVYEELYKIINNQNYRSEMIDGYNCIREILGEEGTAGRSADYLLDFLVKNSTE